MRKIIIFTFAALALVTASNATQYSKLAVIQAAKKAGVWDKLVSWLQEWGYYDEFLAAQYLTDEYVGYSSITNQLVSSGVLTSDDITKMLTYCKDPAIPDSAIQRVYDSDMMTASGRVRWHGKVIETRVDTNTLTKTQIHEDGWANVQSFKTVSAMGLEKKLTAAELAAKRKAESDAKAAAEAKKKAARISVLENSETLADEVSKLMASKGYPEELARLLLMHELNQLKGTVTITTTVTPQP